MDKGSRVRGQGLEVGMWSVSGGATRPRIRPPPHSRTPNHEDCLLTGQRMCTDDTTRVVYRGTSLIRNRHPP